MSSEPVIDSIIAGAEEHIEHLTGWKVTLAVVRRTPPSRSRTEADGLPLIGWRFGGIDPMIYYPTDAEVKDVVAWMAMQWQVQPNLLYKVNRAGQIPAMKQVATVVLKGLYPKLTCEYISKLFGAADHSAAVIWQREGRKLLGVKDALIVSLHDKVKLIIDAD